MQISLTPLEKDGGTVSRATFFLLLLISKKCIKYKAKSQSQVDSRRGTKYINVVYESLIGLYIYGLVGFGFRA